MKRKSFNLVSLILIVIVILALVVLSVYLINKPSKRGKNKENTSDNQTEVANVNSSNHKSKKLDESFFDSLEYLDAREETTEGSNEEPTEEISEVLPEETSQEEPVSTDNVQTINNHTFKLSTTAEATVSENSSTNTQELKINYPNYNFRIIFSTDSSTNFENLKSSSGLKSLIESKYKVSVSDSIRSGTLNGLNLIICSISDNEGSAYLLFTPLNDSEVAYAKIYNKENNQNLLDDLSDSLNEISSIISSVE